jgi:hypothetical protein
LVEVTSRLVVRDGVAVISSGAVSPFAKLARHVQVHLKPEEISIFIGAMKAKRGYELRPRHRTAPQQTRTGDNRAAIEAGRPQLT